MKAKGSVERLEVTIYGFDAYDIARQFIEQLQVANPQVVVSTAQIEAEIAEGGKFELDESWIQIDS